MQRPEPWPCAADPQAALRLHERLADGPPAPDLLARTDAIDAIGGGSPFLSDLIVRERATAQDVFRDGPASALATALASLDRLPADAPRAALASGLRTAKRQVALICAMADIGGTWTLAEVTAALSTLAERAVAKAIDHLLRAAHAAGEIGLPDPADPGPGSGLIVLGMGKLGAGELNYSSDIDLILFHDPEAQPGHDAVAASFTRLAKNLVALLETRDANGYVFRTDLRLRPDPAATPPVVALPAALAYYESMGQNWERAAMTKARPIAGDLAAGRDFLRQIRPFVWRRGLDFAAIADIHAMKRRIDQHRLDQSRRPAGAAGIAGLDVKLAPGGIREIEFAAQTLQLVWGGRDPLLRDATTLGALRGLVRAGRIGRRAAAELTVAYRFLRRVEHRLQMVADRQTHAVPAKADELARFAVFFGCRDAEGFGALLDTQMARVRRRYAEVFENVPEPPGGALSLDLSGMDDPPATVAALRALGFTNTAGVIAAIRGWRAGRIRALRSGRARELMQEMLPPLLDALGHQADPDAAFFRFDALLQRLPAGVQILSMFQRNPALLGRVALVLGAAPMLAEHLASEPTSLEGLLGPEQSAADPARTLQTRLLDASALEDVIAVTRALVQAEEFRLGVGQIEGWIDVNDAGLARTALADAALEALLQATLREQAVRYGRVRGGAMAVVALGKAGSREMMAGSDLDLMLIYTHPPQALESDGPRCLPASTWFIRAAHAFVAALTAPGRDGPLYAVDMRLRPSGNKGPVAVSLEAFRRYHAHDVVPGAWTWERMALTRARVVAGGPAIRRRTERAIADALAFPQPASATLADAVSMRARMLRELPPSGPWDVKLQPGGGIEVEFIAQALLLVHGVPPGCQSTPAALRHLGHIRALPAAVADTLVRADRLWRTIQSMRRILVGRSPEAAPPAATEKLLQAMAPGLDLPGLLATMQATAADVRAAFRTYLGDIT